MAEANVRRVLIVPPNDLQGSYQLRQQSGSDCNVRVGVKTGRAHIEQSSPLSSALAPKRSSEPACRLVAFGPRAAVDVASSGPFDLELRLMAWCKLRAPDRQHWARI